MVKVIERKDINVNFQHKLVEVIPDKKEAVFELTADGNEGETATFKVFNSASDTRCKCESMDTA